MQPITVIKNIDNKYLLGVRGNNYFYCEYTAEFSPAWILLQAHNENDALTEFYQKINNSSQEYTEEDAELLDVFGGQVNKKVMRKFKKKFPQFF